MKEGWEYKTIKECCTELFAGGDVPKPDVSPNKTNYFTVPIYTNGVENEGLYGYTSNARVYEPAVTISARGTIGATFRRFTPFYPAIRLITAVPNKDILSINYLYYALKTLTVDNSGTSIPQLTIPNIKKIVLPIPPLSEQQSIVDYLDSAFAKIDAMKANAEKALNEAKALFQASLKEMLEPKEGWEEKKFGDVCWYNKNNGLHKGTRYVGMEHIEQGTGNLLYTISSNEVLSNTFAFNKGDVLYGRLRPYLKKVIVADFDGCCSTEIFPIQSKRIIASFLMYWFLTDEITNKINATCAGCRMPRGNMNDVLKFNISYPPLSEQQSIVATLDSLKSKVDRLKANYEKISKECDALKQALLKEVFEG